MKIKISQIDPMCVVCTTLKQDYRGGMIGNVGGCQKSCIDDGVVGKLHGLCDFGVSPR